MAVALEQFVKRLEDSGILAGDTLQDFLPPKAAPRDAEDLARNLIRQKKLTRFQAEEVYKGQARSLTLGNYVLMDRIGAGGMGQVFKAEHRRMKRVVAVKLLPAAMTKDQAAIARFEREVEAAAKISHPNIVAAFDADCANGVHFLVMELVEGKDLSVLVKKNGPFPVEKAVSYILQAARGLEAAHAEGIVHRDIKPANLLLDKKGVVKILDLGLARLSGDAEGPQQADLTSTGTVMGTVDYMAPEQALDTKTADARADIYSLGCSMFFLLTGKAAYGGDSVMAKLLAHREQPIPSLRKTCPEASEEVERIFRKMLAKTIQDRYQSITEVIADLEQYAPCQDQSIDAQQSFDSSPDAGLTNFFQELSAAPNRPSRLKKVAAPLSMSLKATKKRLLIGGGVLGGMILLACLVVKLTTKDGTLIVVVNEPDAQVEVLSEEGKVEITRQGESGPVTVSIDPGKHQLRVQKEGFVLVTKEFEIESGGKKTIRARLVPLPDRPAVSTVKPAPVPGVKPPAVAAAIVPLDFQAPGFDLWVKEVADLPDQEIVNAIGKRLQALNQKFDGKVTPTFREGILTGLQFATDQVTDISPVRALQRQMALHLAGSSAEKGRLVDLSPLKGMPLTSLNIQFTQVSDLSPLQGMKLTLLACSLSKVADLSPLKDMPLKHVQIEWTQVSDLSPLKGMPLTDLNVGATRVTDLSPLRNMPLTYLDLYRLQVKDYSILQSMPLKHLRLDFMPDRDAKLLRSIATLETINSKPAAEFWQEVEAKQAVFAQWIKDVAALPAEQQVTAVAKKLQELNQGFDGKVKPTIKDEVVIGLQFLTDNVADLSPVRALPGLKYLEVYASQPRQAKLADLSALKGLQLASLACFYTQVADLSPLAGMPLIHLRLEGTLVSDLTPLSGMKLTGLDFGGTTVADLSPLKGMPLTTLGLTHAPITDLSPLQGMPMEHLEFVGTRVTDLEALKGMPLRHLGLPFKPDRDTELLRSIKTLETINKKSVAEFWKEVEAQQAAFTQWMKETAALPAEQQVTAVIKKLQELNPAFDGQATPKIRDDVVIGLQFLTDNVSDISPVRALPGLKVLEVFANYSSNYSGKSKLTELSALKGLMLSSLSCYDTQVSDLSPLVGMPLISLRIEVTLVSDLTPLSGMKLIKLRVGETTVTDLSPLKGMPLTYLSLTNTPIADLSPLQGMPLEQLEIVGTRVADLEALRGMPLRHLGLPFKPERDTELLRSIKSLETINKKPVAEFWKDVENK